MADFIQQFRDAMAVRGIIPPAEILTDGKLHRCDAEGASGKGDAAYVLHVDGLPAGGFTNWRDGQGWQKWCADIERDMSQAESAAYREKVEAKKLQYEARKAKQRAKAQARTLSIWERSTPCTEYDYLARKGIQAHGVRVFYGRLVIPIQTASGVIQSLQFIDVGGEKNTWLGDRLAVVIF